MVSTTKIGVVVLAAIIAGGIGYFVYSNATTGIVEVDITLGEGSDWFSSTNATVTLGQHVEFAIFDDDNNPHVFNITAFNATTGIIQPGYTGRMSFIANQVGNFSYWCPLNATNVQGESNINGTLTVKA